jgi:hypothetical protein
MIPYEELDRALARWKARAQGGSGAVVLEAEAEAEAAPSPVTEAMMEEGADMATPLPIRSEELGSIPNSAAPGTERTGELSVDELEAYEEDA